MTAAPALETVLVTGSSSGFGLAIAQRFAARGWNVAATARNPASIPGWATGERNAALALDVTDEASIAAAVAATIRRFGAIDVLVNNAGYGLFGPLEGTTAEQLEAQFRTNVFGTAAVIRHVLPGMRARRRGVIVNMSSLAGRTADPFASAYDATKFAIEGLSESLRYELEAHDIRVKLVEPGHFKTDFIARSLQLASHDAYQAQLANWMAWVTRSDVDAPPPEKVAETVFKAATDRSRRLRYPVGVGPVPVPARAHARRHVALDDRRRHAPPPGRPPPETLRAPSPRQTAAARAPAPNCVPIEIPALDCVCSSP